MQIKTNQPKETMTLKQIQSKLVQDMRKDTELKKYTKDIKNLSRDIINYEPLIALNGGYDGLDLIKKVIYQANNLLRINGMLAIEIGHYQYKRVSNILKKCKFIEFSKEYDYKRNVRCIISTKTGNN